MVMMFIFIFVFNESWFGFVLWLFFICFWLVGDGWFSGIKFGFCIGLYDVWFYFG